MTSAPQPPSGTCPPRSQARAECGRPEKHRQAEAQRQAATSLRPVAVGGMNDRTAEHEGAQTSVKDVHACLAADRRRRRSYRTPPPSAPPRRRRRSASAIRTSAPRSQRASLWRPPASAPPPRPRAARTRRRSGRRHVSPTMTRISAKQSRCRRSSPRAIVSAPGPSRRDRVSNLEHLAGAQVDGNSAIGPPRSRACWPRGDHRLVFGTPLVDPFRIMVSRWFSRSPGTRRGARCRCLGRRGA